MTPWQLGGRSEPSSAPLPKSMCDISYQVTQLKVLLSHSQLPPGGERGTASLLGSTGEKGTRRQWSAVKGGQAIRREKAAGRKVSLALEINHKVNVSLEILK